jgi:phosphoglycolate phosphatase-like HAD superfamily hydrolase
MQKLVLFDVDGTLIHCGKAPRRAITEAMVAVYGTAGDVDHYPFSGKTDMQIIFDVITQADVDPKIVKTKMQEVILQYLNLLEKTLDSKDVKTLVGIVELLDALRDHSQATLGLLTGNVLQGAKIKLSRAGLHDYFFNGKGTVGAFGSDSMDRNDLPVIAAQRAFEATGKAFQEKNIVIIGDSPYDITCGRSLNVRTIAVGTGWHTEEELREYRPDYFFSDFCDTQTVVNAIMD